jgi:hypothetical protein
MSSRLEPLCVCRAEHFILNLFPLRRGTTWHLSSRIAMTRVDWGMQFGYNDGINAAGYCTGLLYGSTVADDKLSCA